ncbi:DUF493 domain-containing protein [Sphingobacterium yanglingense]|uniref:DUF493 domain-containing protein n=1 Tax=Sphingobacterium yanglingense TaxID=1437280 RepID=A0A4R6W989_9SPHI|nr:DUF493 domain-containing protein [Sphingobacterium yanglingense]TDQ75731.1 hypothetical protein CLV99_3425 [Sphingobacterium yanglingense]
MKDLGNISIQDINQNDGVDFYASFREKLMDVEQFPTLYTFKFIVPATADNKQAIEAIFEHPSTKIQIKDSKTGKYNSLTVETFVNSADGVIAYYKKVSSIEKVIML